ncbi:A/G-specific adenine glycosylase [Negadavirga shengliensis]|uniref:Adenine DNA glycosylase n=1 Tax=Negadavirga shengliensis TaxID=1389218 RepID=A0ABV9SVF1_9BACT
MDLKILNIKYFTDQLLHWYPLHQRDLPWRSTDDPYIIWLSEIILQQTRVTQGLPYFYLFLEKFPDVFSLAKATEEEVMRCWQGLGYYSRARNLHRCAKEIVADHGGQFPDNYHELLKLKGVGSYTAAAIASFAFKEKVAVLDGNVFRVLSRYFGISEDISGTSGKKTFQKLANEVIPDDLSDVYNQAVMEFGALQCVPRSPVCKECPLALRCFAYQHQAVEQLPYKTKRVKINERYLWYFHIICDGHVVINRREDKDIWRGLVDFPSAEKAGLKHLEEVEPNELPVMTSLKHLGPVVDFPLQKPFKHVLTHQRIFASFAKITVPKEMKKQLGRWAEDNLYELAASEKLELLGKPKLIVRYLNHIK